MPRLKAAEYSAFMKQFVNLAFGVFVENPRLIVNPKVKAKLRHNVFRVIRHAPAASAPGIADKNILSALVSYQFSFRPHKIKYPLQVLFSPAHGPHSGFYGKSVF
jgi:hypothetical protein